MSAVGFTPIQLFRTTTASATPTALSLADGELAINLTDEKLYFKNAAGVVKLLASNSGSAGSVTSVDVSGGTTGLTTSGGPITSSGTITLAGTLNVANGGTGVTTSTGTGSVVLSNSPTLVTPTLGAASATSIANGLGAVGTPSYTFTGDTNTGMWSPAADTLAFSTAGSERVRVTSTGDVGIGTNSPASVLHASSGAVSSDVISENTNGGVSAANKYGFAIREIGSERASFRYLRDGTGNTELTATGPLLFNTNSAERMRIDGSGNVGIGTSSPGAKFEVSVNGTTSAFFRLTDTQAGGRVWSINNGFPAVGTLSFYDNTAAATRMVLDSSGNVGIGTSSPVDKLQISNALATTGTGIVTGNGITLQNTNATAGNYTTIQNRDAAGNQNAQLQFINVTQGSPFQGVIAFATRNSTGDFGERMRITPAGDVGIGTSSPLGRLDVREANRADSTNIPNVGIYTTTAQSTGVGGTLALGGLFNGSDVAPFGSIRGGKENSTSGNYSGYLAFQTIVNGNVLTERMRIDSSGNVGIGTSSPGYRLDVASSGTSAFRVSGPANVLSDLTDGTITLRQQIGDGAAMGTVGAHPFVFRTNNTERMRIDSSGNLGLGVTPNAWFPGYTALQTPGGAFATFGTSTLRITQNNFFSASTSDNRYINNGHATDYTQVSGTHSWLTAPSGTAGNAISFTQAMTLSAGQKLSIGTSATDIAVAYLVTQSAGDVDNIRMAEAGVTSIAPGIRATGDALVLKTSGAERMRIDGSGNLLVGKSSVSTTTVGAELQANGTVISTRSGSTNATSTFEVYSTGAGAFRFFVGMDGTIGATNTSISAISDIRLKENVRDLDAGLDTILALKPRRFDWKEGKGKNVKDDMGFIAQEVEDVLPALIGGWKAGEGEPDDLKSVKAGDLIPVLVKAIQELTARVAQLEGN